jgi:phosphoribosyl 1,2-cyclic phosphate phosphodiesterase
MLTTADKKNILVDTTPDLRTQLLRERINRVDAVIITHDHADHTHGMDDLRPLCRLHGVAIPVHCTFDTAQGLRKKFDYVFERHKIFHSDRPVLGGGIPTLDLVEFEHGPHHIADEPFEFFALPHGYHTTSGFQHHGLAYIIDCNDVPASVLIKLRDAQLDWLVLDCVQPTPHQTHMGWEKAREILEFIRPKQAGLIHMNHDWDHEEFDRVIKAAGLDWAAPLKDGDVLHYSSR